VKILLLQPPWAEVYGAYRDAARIGNAYPPLGLCYLAAVARKEGHDIRIIDAEAEGKAITAIIKEAQEFSPNLIGITASSPIFRNARLVAQKAKQVLNAPIILGGPHVTVMPEQAMEEGKEFDYAVYGEGEHTFLHLLDALQKDAPPAEVPGLIWRKGKDVIVNPPRPFIKDLDGLPFPDRSLLDLSRYSWGVPGIGVRRMTTVMTTRGCPFRCIFCSQRTMFGTAVRFRNPESILAEIEDIVRRHGVRHLAFIDDTLTLKRERMVALCEGILKKKLKITWEGWTRAECVDEELLRIMKRAGLVRISFGIESGDPNILKIIQKDTDFQKLKKAYKAAKKTGLETRGSAMLGHPYETRTSALRTIRFLRSLKNCDQLYLNIAVPYPGTKLYEMAHKGEGGLKLLTQDLSRYRRYGDAVIEVNNLSRNDLVRLQRIGFLAFYMTPRRIYYNLLRAGILPGLRNVLAFARGVFKIGPLKKND
jgi:radical SAM superfamily enzyme YgiQ (UPF0313 family)